jgi:hypothetical protein
LSSKLFNEIKRLVGIFCCRTGVGQHTASAAVDNIHYRDLLSPLVQIGLIYTDTICPQDLLLIIAVQGANVLQSQEEGVGDVDGMILIDKQHLRCQRRTPDI